MALAQMARSARACALPKSVRGATSGNRWQLCPLRIEIFYVLPYLDPDQRHRYDGVSL